MAEITLSAQTARDLYDQVCDPGLEDCWVSGWQKVAVDLITEGRWTALYRMVLREETAPHRLWGLDYQEGLTEMQEVARPWEDAGTVPLYEVEAREVTTVTYVPVGGE